MSRSIKPRWCARDKAWLVPLGEVSEVTGRRKYIVLRNEQGQKIAGNDHVGKTKALRRLQDIEALGPTVFDVTCGYLTWHETRGSKPNTLQDYIFHLNKFGRFEHNGIRYYDRPASSITLKDLARIRESMEKRGCQSGYIRHLYSSVLACWRWATRPIEGRKPERLLDVNPLDGAELPRTGRSQKPIVPLSTIADLLQFAGKRADCLRFTNHDAAWRKVWMLRLIAESGCRPTEACILEWSWVDEQNRVIVIPGSIYKTGWRKGEDRIIRLTGNMAEMFMVIRLLESTHPKWVFALSHYKQAPSRHGFDHWFASLRRAAIEYGIPITSTFCLYDLRHAFVTQVH